MCIFGDTESDYFSVSSEDIVEMMQKEIDYQTSASSTAMVPPKIPAKCSRLKDLMPDAL